MSDQPQPAAPSPALGAEGGFVWHPVHAGKSFDAVYAELVDEIRRDQRSYQLAMDGAEGAEHDSLTTIVELERRWSTYDFDWAEIDPRVLARRILTFEQERERRQEHLSFDDYRASGALVQADHPASTPVSRTIPILPIGIAILVVLLIVLGWIIFS